MRGWSKDIGDSLSLSFELVLPTIIGALLGYYIDRRLGSFPIVLIIGLFLGAAAGFWNVARKYIGLSSQKEKR
ncbi:MAG: AtpZ/AtpI family protein [Candidatus Margulisbacteria bacterium]|nr:AtpZ/AtpI family protein [Candidatus Margulisiibacteriota bacterium]